MIKVMSCSLVDSYQHLEEHTASISREEETSFKFLVPMHLPNYTESHPIRSHRSFVNFRDGDRQA
jgi:hypothetical protein